MRATEVVAGETFVYMARDGQVNGVNYGALLLRGEGVDSTYDPELKPDPLVVVGYWPGGIDTDGHQYLVHSVNGHNELNIQDEQHFVRNLLAGAVVDPAALERYRHNLSEHIRTIHQANVLGIAAVTAMCMAKEVPLSYVMICQVVESQKIKSGERVATLYFPLGLEPEASLKAIRDKAEQTAAEEAI